MGRFRDVELDEVQLNGPRLLLRDWRWDDAEDVHRIMQDPSMHEFLALPVPYTLDAARRFVTELGHEGRRDGTGLGGAVVERETGRLVGAAALRIAADGEIGFWIAPEARGHGYAAEATRMLTDWAFGHGLGRVRMLADVRNLASIRTALRAGLSFEGVGRGALVSGSDGTASARRADLARFARLPGDPGNPIPPSFPPLGPPAPSDGVLTLRMAGPDDADAMIESEDAVSVGWNFTGTAPAAEQSRRRAAAAGLQWLVGTTANIAMVDVQSGEVAGFVDVRRSGPPQVGGVGYTVLPRFRGRGFTGRALRLVRTWAFEVADFARLELGAKQANIASQRAAESGGFEPDGVRRARLRNADGTFSDEVRYCSINPAYDTRL
ncbi:MAG TPA: GNAT family N-acetyltransferase [Jatrophihabitans sp.]|nr:GNAT family N-acetyltransferase [Jatrophihabitans sp.]